MPEDPEALSRDAIALIALHGLLSGGVHPVHLAAEKSFFIADQFLENPDYFIGGRDEPSRKT